MTDARERLEALLRVIDDAERENEAVGVDDWYARAALLGALQTCRRAAQDVLDAMPEGPSSGWIGAGVWSLDCDSEEEGPSMLPADKRATAWARGRGGRFRVWLTKESREHEVVDVFDESRRAIEMTMGKEGREDG
jgi:hypothetical protein